MSDSLPLNELNLVDDLLFNNDMYKFFVNIFQTFSLSRWFYKSPTLEYPHSYIPLIRMVSVVELLMNFFLCKIDIYQKVYVDVTYIVRRLKKVDLPDCVVTVTFWIEVFTFLMGTGSWMNVNTPLDACNPQVWSKRKNW